ncbi:TlpA family protein disulfide reductase [Emticicia oligotrophica]
MKEIKCYVGVFIGVVGNKKTIVVDANNNHDFSDDMLIEYDISDNSKYDDEYKKLFPIYKIEYEYFDKKTINKVEYVKVFPAHKSYTYKKVEEEIKAIYFTSFGYYSGVFNYEKQTYKVAISNQRSWPKYEIKGIDFSIKKKNQLHVYNDWFKSNQNIAIDNINIEVLDYDFITDNLVIKISKRTNTLGWQEGDICPPIYAKKINKDSVNINNYFSQKDFTVIDFWGSWCKPCLEEMPNMENVYERLKTRSINMISIACEYDTNDYVLAQKIINAKKIGGIKLFEKLNTGITTTLKIDSYPSLILINKEGQIVKRFYGRGMATKLEDFLSK